uniref:hypothetical protein n=1 Tax=uncultured Caulobacter sp. TaxID=158749 RepID=UPI0025ECD457|nr:hypothetical protein [uncultured Caulobacter sp.]
MSDLMVVLICVFLVIGSLAYARLWLTEVGDLMWMAGLRPRIVVGSLVLTGLIVNLMSLWILPAGGMTATRLALALLVAPTPARWLADWIAWMQVPKDGREPFKAGAVFDQASARQQSEFIRSLGEADGAAPREL